MGLSAAQLGTYQRIRTNSSSKQYVLLTDDAVRILVYIAARDMGVADLPPPEGEVPELFDPQFTAGSRLSGSDPKQLFTDLCQARHDADTYVACLTAIHKARLKYRKILSTQPYAQMDQVGPRGLLQYGLVDASPLAALLVWRKWFYDLDNRAAQDTGYLIEPVIAGALGGISYSARNSPVKRTSNPAKGRQVDCIKDSFAYEFKLRMTIAASGQGRWLEEIVFAEDCRNSGFTPVLVVLDPTQSSKLVQLQAAFERAGGVCYVGESAWEHLRSQAQPDMKAFLIKYIESPLKDLFLSRDSEGPLPSFEVHDETDSVRFAIGDYQWAIERELNKSSVLESENNGHDLAQDLLPGKHSRLGGSGCGWLG